jgi:hypothetical protein
MTVLLKNRRAHSKEGLAPVVSRLVSRLVSRAQTPLFLLYNFVVSRVVSRTQKTLFLF